MAVNTMNLPSRCMTPNYNTLSSTTMSPTPGSAFMNRKSAFATVKKGFCHYKLDTGSPQLGVGGDSAPKRRRATMNICFNAPRNEIDPYVSASNWLPRFKAVLLGFMARDRTRLLKEKHDAAKVVQRACSAFIDPWMSLYNAVKPLLKTHQMDELKKYLRECVIQIKRLQSERVYIENQLVDVEDSMNQTMKITENSCLSIEGRKSPNPFKDINSINHDANHEFESNPIIQKVLKLDLPEFKNLEAHIDTSVCYNSKVEEVYELSDRVQQKVHENRHLLRSLRDQVSHSEHELLEVRKTAQTLENSGRMQKGVINKMEKDLESQRDRVNKHDDVVGKLNKEKETLQLRLRDVEGKMNTRSAHLEEAQARCEELVQEVEQRRREINQVNTEKNRLDIKMKDTLEQLSYSQEELESAVETRQQRERDLKRRHAQALKATEEETAKIAKDARQRQQELGDTVDSLQQQLEEANLNARKQQQEAERRRWDDDSRGLDEEDGDFERERKLTLQTKSLNAELATAREELKILESSYSESRTRIQELEKTWTDAEEEKTEYRKSIERLKGQHHLLKSTSAETELKLNRAVREKNFLTQKVATSKETIDRLEENLTQLKEDVQAAHQSSLSRSRELETLQTQLADSRREVTTRLALAERQSVELRDLLETKTEAVSVATDEAKKARAAFEDQLTELQQMLDEKDDQIEKLEDQRSEEARLVIRLNRRIRDNDDIQKENERKISKLRKEILEDNISSSMENIQTLDSRNLSTGRLNSSSSSSNQPEGYSTLPTRGSSSKSIQE